MQAWIILHDTVVGGTMDYSLYKIRKNKLSFESEYNWEYSSLKLLQREKVTMPETVST
jgi:hypothetical protein